MPKGRNVGGSGLPSSTQMYDVVNRRKQSAKYHGTGKFGTKLTPEELELYFDGKEIQCLECGGMYKSISGHLVHAHAISKEEYKEKYGIPKNKTLICSNTRELYVKNGNTIQANASDDALEKMAENRAKGHRVMEEMRVEAEIYTCSICECEFERSVFAGRNPLFKSRCDSCTNKKGVEATKKSAAVIVGKHRCKNCNNDFDITRDRQQKLDRGVTKETFCSRGCAMKFVGNARVGTGKGRTMLDFKCNQCGCDFKNHRKGSKFCSHKCSFLSRLENGDMHRIGKKGGIARAAGLRDKQGKFKQKEITK